ncbi:HEAT repeat domain-containing protein [Blastopirellula sp. JC732]|uniref:HEAT repeat domain-containing protein n=1 Tax=Blastopirellula sediminis TaxID=2894196 RepID=A0A9X1SH57_9BACT|nr:HEAT repeat domain-containing protein [Blastopirellula sediminis]MCC9606584.1 HEAT repeat domain-containing protein [Blastopirellula sediminis]MCC9630118.1 HEAT repeat domain-containing protein [Blastopirellula sediminis]
MKRSLLTICWILLAVGTVAAQAPAPSTTPAPPVDSPAVAAIRESNPTTPLELAEAAALMVDLGRADVANEYLNKILTDKPSDEDLVKLQAKFGSGPLIRFQNLPALQPAGTDVANLVFAAVEKLTRNPAFLQQQVDALASTDENAVRSATIALRGAGAAAIEPLLLAFAKSDNASVRTASLKIILKLGQDAEPALWGALDSNDPQIKAAALSALGALRSNRSLDVMVGPAVNPSEPAEVRKAASQAVIDIVGAPASTSDVEKFLTKRIEGYLAGEPVFSGGPLTTMDVWTWNDAAPHLTKTTLSLADASTVWIARMARDLAAINPHNEENARLRMLTALQSVIALNGPNAPIKGTPADAAAQELGPAAVEDALAYALTHPNLTMAAIAACRWLGEQGNVAAVFPRDGRESPLATALSHGNFRVQAAAVDAILALDPKEPYAGSSALIEALITFARTSGERIAVIADPDSERAQELAGLLTELGYSVISRCGRREFFDAIYSTPDVELIFISDAVDRPGAFEMVQIVHRDKRTATTPIGVIPWIDDYSRWQVRLSDDPYAMALIRAHDIEGLTFQIQQLYALEGRLLVDAAERAQRGQMALAALAKLSSDPAYKFYDLVLYEKALADLITNPVSMEDAATLLANLGTPTAQCALVNTASENARPIAERQIAAKAFADSVKKFGLRLTRHQILLQYERYNESETYPRETQDVLASLLDTMEASAKGVRLDQPGLVQPVMEEVAK